MGRGLTAAEPLVKQPDGQQGDQHDGAYAVDGAGDDGRHVAERKQQKTGGEIIGRSNEHAKEKAGLGERLTPGDAHGHAEQQGGDEGNEQKGVLERSLSEILEKFGGCVRTAATQQQEHEPGAASCLPTAALQVDRQEGRESREHAGPLHSEGTLPTDQHGGGHERAQLHEGGGERHAVAGDVPLERQKAARIHCAADQPKPGGEGDALPRQGHRSGEGGGQNRTHQVIAHKHVRTVMDARFA